MNKNGNHRRDQHVPDIKGDQHVPADYNYYKIAVLHGDGKGFYRPIPFPKDSMPITKQRACVNLLLMSLVRSMIESKKLTCILDGCDKPAATSYILHAMDITESIDNVALLCCQAHINDERVINKGSDFIGKFVDPDATSRCISCNDLRGDDTIALVEGLFQLCRNCRRQYCKVCLTSPEKGEKFKICGGCKIAAYCSAKCQKKDWQEHKAVCRKK